VADLGDAQTDERLQPGTKVEVRRRFDQHWSRGFAIAEATDDGYRLTRLSDGAVLPVVFDEDEVRPEKKRSGMWWY
jgi:hypothetical protein